MKTWKTIIILILIIGVLSFGSYIIFLILNPSTIIRGKAVEYHTKEELSDLYWQNEELLNSVKNSVLSNKKVLQALIDEQDGDTGIYTKHDEIYFSQEEWSDIVSVFENLHPYMIMMERKGRPLIFYMPFGSLEEDDTTKRTYLYWFPNEEEREYHEKPGVFPDGVFTQLDEGWYIVEETDTR